MRGGIPQTQTCKTNFEELKLAPDLMVGLVYSLNASMIQWLVDQERGRVTQPWRQSKISLLLRTCNLEPRTASLTGFWSLRNLLSDT